MFSVLLTRVVNQCPISLTYSVWSNFNLHETKCSDLWPFFLLLLFFVILLNTASVFQGSEMKVCAVKILNQNYGSIYILLYGTRP